ncbi:LysR family transcriptional regulator [Undibacterium sp. TS12]|uniref:LysR family transcriptional regulator n=1 Tax=Undibacterium sp. TS12 TaxID=2908202 RepID=UPI001F4CAA53|nr:LysR family transcriptional regulator [Undibacterium sp. TS12]MCH8617708.1 LysR family transcriptional regulator [Undibacterium sp. TS12]
MKLDVSQRVPAMLSFIQAADHGSFAAAARSLQISAAAVSKNVASLEKALGVRLMNRSTRSLQLTPEGQSFLEKARIAIDALDHAVESVTRQHGEVVGPVRISTGNAFGMHYLLPLLPKLQERHPGLQLAIDFDDHRIDLVRDGYDLALRGGMIEDSSVVSRTICTLHMALVAAPAYLERHGIPKTIDDLDKHRLIAVRFLNGKMTSWSLKHAQGAVNSPQPRDPALIVSAPEAAVEAALLGMGIAQVGVHHASRYLHEKRLKIVLGSEHAAGNRQMVLQYPHRALVAPRIKATVDFLLEEMAKTESLHIPLSALHAFHA